MYNLIECSDVYLKTSGSLWQYYRDESALEHINNIIDFPANKIVFRLNLNSKSQGKQDTVAEKMLK